MKFSIITPSYNQGRFIRDCIESVRAQDGIETEHVIVDACSTDETLSILKEYAHLKWTSEPDKGQTDAINKGFRRATGDWLMWLNADDYLLPGALRKVAEFAAANPDADVIYGDCDFVDEAGRFLRHKREFDFDFNMLLFYGCYIPSTSTFYRRKIVDDGFLLDPTYKNCMDFEYYLKLAHAGYRFRHMPATLANFRWHDSNVSTVHAARRYRERLRLQRQYLRLTGRSCLSAEWLLRVLFRAYQARRALRRALTRRVSA
jgi:glycosyltransferase involved in cell wall biosynthesis